MCHDTPRLDLVRRRLLLLLRREGRVSMAWHVPELSVSDGVVYHSCTFGSTIQLESKPNLKELRTVRVVPLCSADDMARRICACIFIDA